MPFRKRQQILNGVKNPNAKEVRVSIVFTRLGEIDTINERFSCEATLFITWRESTSILQKCVDPPDAATAAALSSSNVVAGADSNSYYWDASKLWDPQLYIDNAIGDVKEKDVKFRLEKLFDENKKEWYFEVHMIKRIQGTFFEKLELYHFPFDVQDLSVTLTSHRTVDEIVLIQDFNIPPKMTKSASLDKHIWKLYDHVNIKAHTIRNDLPPTSEYSSEEFEIACSHSALTMQCRVSRKPGYFIINCLLPTLMITLCVFFTFMMDYQRFQYRFSLLFTTMLTSITFRWAIHGRVLPTISYMTFLDVYCVSSIMIVFSAMVWHATYLVIYKQDSVLAERCDLYAMITFAIVVILIHIMQTFWFIVAFKKRYELEQLDKKAALSYLKARMSVAQNANNKLNRAAAVNKANNVTDPLLPPPPPPSQPHDDIFNAESKIGKANRPLY